MARNRRVKVDVTGYEDTLLVKVNWRTPAPWDRLRIERSRKGQTDRGGRQGGVEKWFAESVPSGAAIWNEEAGSNWRNARKASSSIAATTATGPAS